MFAGIKLRDDGKITTGIKIPGVILSTLTLLMTVLQLLYVFRCVLVNINVSSNKGLLQLREKCNFSSIYGYLINKIFLIFKKCSNL
jgi:hypothetical protein